MAISSSEETETGSGPVTRRSLFRMIGLAGGSALMYQAMTALGHAQESGYDGPLRLDGNVRGASVLILGAGLAGMCAALELRKAGYSVNILEYNDRAGGRNWTIRGGDRVSELGGFTQSCEFDKGLYFNLGPWRIPHHHRAVLDYCKRLNVALEPFTQVNYNAYIHSNGSKHRYREVEADFHGHVAELLSKAAVQGKLDDVINREDREKLLESLRQWGALDKNFSYGKGAATSLRRGFDLLPGGGLDSAPIDSHPQSLNSLLQATLWRSLSVAHEIDYQPTLFQPVGGMDMIGKAFARELPGVIRYKCKVTAIAQDERSVKVTYQDMTSGNAERTISADWCICTIPASILGQLPLTVGAPMKSAVDAIAYGPSSKVGLQFKRRFWEEDESIYGGISYTDQSISLISYPSTGYFGGKGVVTGAYAFGARAYELTALSPSDRIELALEQGSRVHAQYRREFETGVSIGWHRVPWTLGCYARWTPEMMEQHYENLCAMDGRILLAGEHVSRLPAWQEGALLSGLDAVKRLHKRVVA